MTSRRLWRRRRTLSHSTELTLVWRANSRRVSVNRRVRAPAIQRAAVAPVDAVKSTEIVDGQAVDEVLPGARLLIAAVEGRPWAVRNALRNASP